MDLDGATRPTTTAAASATSVTASASAESTVLAEKSVVPPEKKEKEVTTSSGKNGSAPDSTDEKSALKDGPKNVTEETTPNTKGEQKSKAEELKSPTKQAQVTTTGSPSTDAELKEKVASNSVDAAGAAGSLGNETPAAAQDDEHENDDLLLRLEALEKGEDPDLVVVEKKKEPEANHQNGVVEKTSAPELQAKSKDSNEVIEASGAGSAADKKQPPPANTGPAGAAEPSPKKPATKTEEHTASTSQGGTESAEAVSSNAKRKHSHNEPETTSIEPQTKKVHVADVTDSVAPAAETETVAKVAAEQKLGHSVKSAAGESSVAVSSAKPVAPKVDSMEGETLDKPPSVEKMDVDVSPEPETSSAENADTLPDTEPNTEPEEISSSVAEAVPARSKAGEDKSANKSENSNVSSSDDKQQRGVGGSNDKAKPPESEVSASAVPEDEAMDVDDDDDEVDMAESSTAVPVVEPPCVKKSAYLCTDDVDKPDGGPQKESKTSSTSTAATTSAAAALPAKSAVDSSASSSSSAAVKAAPVPAASTTSSPEKKPPVKVELQTPTKAHSSGTSGSTSSSSGAAGNAGTPAAQSSEPAVVDSSNKAVDNSSEKPAPRPMDESVVESSQPSSSSDTKKQQQQQQQKQPDSRLTLSEHLREAVVHRGAGLLAKATSTPTNSNSGTATLAASSPVTPRTLHPVTTSAVSSSNVYSSTPIHHANFMKGVVSSENVSTITNPPSSVETSRVEADDTATTATLHTPSTDQSGSTVEQDGTAEGKSSSAASATSTAKSFPLSVTPSKTGDAATAAASKVKSSPPKKDLLKRDGSYSTSSSSLKTTDLSEVDSCTVASAMNTAEEINMYAANARKFNGISSTSEGSELDVKVGVPKSLKASAKVKQEEDDGKVEASLSSTVSHLDLSGAISPSTSAEQQYEVSVWYDGKDLQFLSVERIHGATTGGAKGVDASTLDPCTTGGATAVTQDTSSMIIDSSSKQSSSTTNGSVSSLGPFPLAEKRASMADPTAHSSDSSSASLAAGATTAVSGGLAAVAKAMSNVPQMKQTVKGPIALCDLLLEEIIKLRRSFAPDEETDQALHTPKASGGSGRGQQRSSGSAKKSATSARGQKRTKAAADSDEDDEAVGEQQRTPRGAGSSATKQSQAKKAKSSDSPTVTTTSTATPKAKISTAERQKQQFDICCLARWTDRKYYAGRVTNYRGDNKYVVVFEDGCSKTLSRDIIVFGEDGILPILNHSIHALTGGDTYEPAIVEEIKRGGEEGESVDVVYAVRTATSALEVTATDIYLTDEQAKWIHNSLKDKPDPVQQLLLQSSGAGAESGDQASGAGGAGGGTGDGSTIEGAKKEDGGIGGAEHGTEATGDKNARSTRSKRGASDKSMTPVTQEAGYSGGVGKKGRRGRRKHLPPPEPNISEGSDASDGYEDEVPTPLSPETGLDAVDGVQPELQRTEQESELARMMLVSQYFDGKMSAKDEANLYELLGPIPVGAKTLFRNKHFLLSCTIPLKMSSCNGDSADVSKFKQFSNVPFVKQHVRRQIEAAGGKVYQFFEDVPKNKYKLCKLIAPRPSTTALYVQCLACDIPIVSHEWIVKCCQVLMLVDHKPYALPCGWSFLEKRYIDDRGSGRTGRDKRSSATPFASISINVASLCKDFNDFWSRVCKLAGATVRLIKTESDVTENLTGYLLTDQEFPEDIKIKATRSGLLVVSTVWVVQCLIVGRVCHPTSHEKLTQIYQEEDY